MKRTDIPIPEWEMPKEAQQLLDMKQGESIPAGHKGPSRYFEIAKALSMVITCRLCSETNEYRIWRML